MPCHRSCALWRDRPRSSIRTPCFGCFDFFSSAAFDPERLRSRLPFFRNLDLLNPDAWVHRKRDNLEASVDRGGAVKVAFFGGLDTLKLAGMKMRVIQVRGSWGDGTLHRVPASMQRDLTHWAQAVDLTKLPALDSRHGLSPGGLDR
jgi:hypothetical protein